MYIRRWRFFLLCGWRDICGRGRLCVSGAALSCIKSDCIIRLGRRCKSGSGRGSSSQSRDTHRRVFNRLLSLLLLRAREIRLVVIGRLIFLLLKRRVFLSLL